MTRRARAKLAIITGLLFPAMLLIGGGYVNATNATYWCSVFGIAYAVGLVCPGVLVYQSAMKMPEPATDKSPKRWHFAISGIAILVGILIQSAFFDSDFFSTAVGMHAFTILEAVFMAQLIPLGLGWYFSDAAHTTATPTS
jgi:hypothetical protein